MFHEHVGPCEVANKWEPFLYISMRLHGRIYSRLVALAPTVCSAIVSMRLSARADVTWLGVALYMLPWPIWFLSHSDTMLGFACVDM